jgi:cell division protein FtsI/penicillin-binding protein 2
MASGSANWRLNVVFGLLAVALAALGVRLALLVENHRSQALAVVGRQQRMSIELPARRGDIYFRSGGRYVLAAGSRQVPSCFIDPANIGEDELEDVCDKLGEALGMDPLAIKWELLERRNRRFVWVKREITDAQAKAALEVDRQRRKDNPSRDKKLRPAIGIVHEWRRDYPNGSLGSHVLGFLRKDQKPGAGVELSQSQLLAGTPGRYVLNTDARRTPLEYVHDGSHPPADGNRLMLTIDAIIQGHLESAVDDAVTAHNAWWGVGIVVDPRTGRVLAMTSSPSYDPNAFSDATPEQRTNHLLVSPYEPGSVFKPLIAAAAVDRGVLGWQTRIFCENGVYRAHRGGRITDHGSSYGYLTLWEAIVRSSNIAMAKLGEMLGNEQMHEIVHEFGCGVPTGIELPAESGGRVRPLNSWDGYSLRRIPFGQEIMVTPTQLAMAFSALCNGGKLLRPTIIEQVIGPGGEVVFESSPTVVRQVISPAVSEQSVRVMVDAVEGEGGTGKRARSELYTIFGKTGTAQVGGPSGYIPGAYTGSFIGGAPADNPRLICVISLFRPTGGSYYGGTVAAPYVKDVLERSLGHLGVKPDKQPATRR